MGDIMRRDEIPSASSLSKTGVAAIGYAAAGIFLVVLGVISTNPVVGIIAGGIVSLFGFGSFTSKDIADRRAGFVLLTAGVLTILSKIPIPFFQPFSKVMLGIGAFGLLALGVINGIKFFIGLKKRS